MFYKRLLHSSIVRLSLIAVVLCSITLLGARSTGQAKAASPRIEQNVVTTSELAPNAPVGLVTIHCTVADVGLNYIDNVAYMHAINCSPSTGVIEFFGVIGADTKKGNQLLSVGLTAIATGKPVWLLYDPNDTNIPFPANNRKVLNFGLLSQ